MPRGVYKRKKTKAARQEIAQRAAATRRANAEKKATATATKPKRRKSKRFLSDDEKGTIVGHFLNKPGSSYESWGAVAAEIEQELSIPISVKQAQRLAAAFSLPLTVEGQSDANCEKRLARIEAMLAEMKASIESWTE